jgi:hypothetical protein
VPTLIDCELLKIASLNTPALTTPALRLALLLKQQRSEIMQPFLYIVNWFLTRFQRRSQHHLATILNRPTAPHSPFQSFAPRCQARERAQF